MFEPWPRQTGKTTAARRVAAAAASASVGTVRLTPAAIAAMLGRCTACDDEGHVCENHPDRPWAGISIRADACDCGAGMPCGYCCDPIPQDGTASITDAFTPRKFRGAEPVDWPTLGYTRGSYDA